MAAMWWLATIMLFLLLVVCIIFVIVALKSAIHTEDAVTIDPLPDAGIQKKLLLKKKNLKTRNNPVRFLRPGCFFIILKGSAIHV